MTVLDAGCLVFDLETTAADPEVARMVQACSAIAEVADGVGQWHAEVELVQPGIPIPPEATEVHHITDEQVADAVLEGVYAPLVWRAIQATWSKGWPLVIFNAPYDLTVLDRALRRAGHEGITEVGPVIDPLVLDKACDTYRRGKRTLTAMAANYGVDIPEGAAHSADGDCFTTVRVGRKILEHMKPYGQARPLEDFTLAELQEFQGHAYAMQKSSLFNYFRRTGVEITDESLDWPIRPWIGLAVHV